jgi:hypothetical protein
MNADSIAAALRPCATGIYPLQAGVALLTRNGTFLHRDDFTSRFIQHGTSSGTPMAASEASRTFVPTVNDSPQPCSTRPSSIVVSSVVNQL